jgi:hypothetical protein
MFKPLSTKEIRMLSSVTRYRVERKRPLMLILTIAVVAALCIGYLVGSYQAESEARVNCRMIRTVK